MRTTLDIDDDVLQAAKEIAEKDDTTAGKVLSALARKGLVGTPTAATDNPIYRMKNGVPVLPATGEIVTMAKIRQIMDEEAI